MFIIFDYLMNIFQQPTKIEEKQQQKNEKRCLFRAIVIITSITTF